MLRIDAMWAVRCLPSAPAGHLTQIERPEATLALIDSQLRKTS